MSEKEAKPQEGEKTQGPNDEGTAAPSGPSLFRRVLRPERNGLLVYFLLFIMVSSLGFVGTSTVFFMKIIQGKEHHAVEKHPSESEEHSTEHASADAEHGEESVVLGTSQLPQKIRKEQDGTPEPDRDLVEPEIQAERSLAAIVEPHKEMKLDLGARYIRIPGVFTSLREGRKTDGMMTLDLSFEVNSTEVQLEIERRGTEIQSLVSSMANLRSKTDIMNPKGLLKFKSDILTEVNLMLGSGKITDVYITEFHVR